MKKQIKLSIEQFEKIRSDINSLSGNKTSALSSRTSKDSIKFSLTNLIH